MSSTDDKLYEAAVAISIYKGDLEHYKRRCAELIKECDSLEDDLEMARWIAELYADLWGSTCPMPWNKQK